MNKLFDVISGTGYAEPILILLPNAAHVLEAITDIMEQARDRNLQTIKVTRMQLNVVVPMRGHVPVYFVDTLSQVKSFDACTVVNWKGVT